jgi:hypothetical protein
MAQQRRQYHREDGPAREWPAQGAKAWYRNGKLHRDDGPAMEGPLGKGWYRRGMRHREDGPAVEHADGRKEWYRQGKELTASEFAAIRKKEPAEIGDAFKTGLTRKSPCPGRGLSKTPRRNPRPEKSPFSRNSILRSASSLHSGPLPCRAADVKTEGLRDLPRRHDAEARIQYVGHNCDDASRAGRQQTVLRKTQATEALPPWPRRAVPFALPRP